MWSESSVNNNYQLFLLFIRDDINCMESVSKINKYTSERTKQTIYTINLNTGVTPSIINYADQLWQSNCYNLTTAMDLNYQRTRAFQIIITLGWYRPKKEEFDKLEKSYKQHVLNGGLLNDLFHKAIHKTLDDNEKINTETNYQKFQIFCKEYYGTTLDEFEGTYSKYMKELIKKGMR